MNFLLIPAWVFEALQYAAVPLALAAGALLAIAFLTARRGWEPRCRRCAHDLRSVKPSVGACPECGADLSKPDAVRTGRRRVRPVVATLGFALLALTAGAAWKLNAAGTRVLRGRLVSSMPLQSLVDALFEGGETGMLAQGALVQNGVLSVKTPRDLESGALLDAVLHAADRCEETGRRPLAVVLQSDARALLGKLDNAEIDTLVAIAADELVASGGMKMSRYQIALAIQRPTGEPTGLWNRIIDRLNATAEGRRVLAPQLATDGELSSGAAELISLMQPLRPKAGALSGGMTGESTVTFVCGEALLESADGSVRRPLAVLPRQRRAGAGSNDPTCELLIDAPPGKYRLTAKGALAKTVLLPRADSSFEAPPAISVEDALKLEGSTPYDGSCEVVVRAPTVDARRFVNDEDTITRATRLLSGCKIETRSGRASVALDSITGVLRARRSQSDEIPPPLSLHFSARQGEKTWRLGSFTSSDAGYSGGMGSLSEELVLSEPFELIAVPLTAANANGSRASARSTGSRSERSEDAATYPWATFTLKFESATKQPTVEVTNMPFGPSTGTGRDDDATRRAIAAWVASIPATKQDHFATSEPDAQPPQARTVRLNAGTRFRKGEDGRTLIPYLDFDWPAELHFAGWFELWSGDRLAAPARPVFGALAADFSLPSMTPVFPVADDAMLVVRFQPDARVGSADGSGPFAFVSAPFEVRFASLTAAPELVWLDGAPASGVEERKTP